MTWHGHIQQWVSYFILFQSKSLIGDTSILFSPPSVIKDTLGGKSVEEVFQQPRTSKDKKVKQVNPFQTN